MEEKIKDLIGKKFRLAGKEYREVITDENGSVHFTTFVIGQCEKIDDDTYFIYPGENKIINAVLTKNQLKTLEVDNIEIKTNGVTIRKFIL